MEKDSNEISFNIYVNKNRQNVKIKCYFFENIDDYVLIRDVRIIPFRMNKLYEVLKLLFVLFVVNLLCIFSLKYKLIISSSFYQNNIKIVFSLFCVVLLSSLPLFIEFVIKGHDLNFHLMRIEGLKDGLLSGAFPVKIQPTWCNNNGYAVGIFYGDLFLYIPAMFRILGVPSNTAYKLYLFLINILTVIISYISFKKLSKDKLIGVLGCALYTLSLYRLNNIFIRSAVGEYTAMAFLPLILLGLYCVYSENIGEKEKQRSICFLVIGFTGVLQSHILSFEMIVLFTGIICIIFIKKTFRRCTLFILLKSVFITILINLWFLVPLLDFMGENLVINDNNRAFNNVYWIQKAGLNIAQLFISTFNKSDMPLGIGWVFVLTLFCVIYKIIIINNIDKEVLLGFFLSLLSLVLTLKVFPYDFLCDKMGKYSILITNLQFPWRFLTLASLFLTWLTCVLVKSMSNNRYYLKKVVCFFGIILLSQLVYFEGTVIKNSDLVCVYDTLGYSSFPENGFEYMPTDTEVTKLNKTLSCSNNKILIKAFSQKYNEITVDVENTDSENGFIDVPLIYYKGYKAVDTSLGKEFETGYGKNNVMRVIIPANYLGTINLYFEEQWYWRMAEFISVFTLLIIASYISFIKCRRIFFCGECMKKFL